MKTNKRDLTIPVPLTGGTDSRYWAIIRDICRFRFPWLTMIELDSNSTSSSMFLNGYMRTWSIS